MKQTITRTCNYSSKFTLLKGLSFPYHSAGAAINLNQVHFIVWIFFLGFELAFSYYLKNYIFYNYT
jgi:hypothetical protein